MADLYQREGSPFFYARIRAGDAVRRITTGERNRRKAQLIADTKEKEFVAEQEAKQRAATTLTLIDTQVRRWRETPVVEVTTKKHKQYLTYLVDPAVIGMKPIQEITAADVRKARAALLTITTPYITRACLQHLSMLMETAIGWDVGVDSNPVRADHLKGLPTAQKRKRYLTIEEYETLHGGLKRPGLKLVFEIGVLAGLRAGEIKSLNWGDIDFKRNVIQIRSLKTKTGIQREVPIPAQLRSTLLSTFERVPNGPDDPVVTSAFGKRYSSIPASVKKVCNKYGFPDVSAHILRHTFASWHLQRGTPPVVVQALLGHSSASMTARYSHPSATMVHQFARDFSTQSGTKPDTE